MTALELSEALSLELVCGNGEQPLEGVYCCDLLSLVMGRAPTGCLWITVMGNVNAVAVAQLRDIGAILLAEGMRPDAQALLAAQSRGITILCATEPVFSLAMKAGALL